jgi:TonB family protein
MTLIGNSGARAFRAVAGNLLLCVVCMLGGMACGGADVAPNATRATPANVFPDVKHTATEAKQADAKPAGKELLAADGPALKSITPPEGAVLGGVLNDIAVELPKPEYPAAGNAEKASGRVTVEVVVNEKGEVVASSVVGGPQPLWSAAGAAARKARFDPPLRDGKPVKVAGVLTFDFDK